MSVQNGDKNTSTINKAARAPGLTEGRPPTLSVHRAKAQRGSSHLPLCPTASQEEHGMGGSKLQNRVEPRARHWHEMPSRATCQTKPIGCHDPSLAKEALFGKQTAPLALHDELAVHFELDGTWSDAFFTCEQPIIRQLLSASDGNYANMQCPMPLIENKGPAGKAQPARQTTCREHLCLLD